MDGGEHRAAASEDHIWASLDKQRDETARLSSAVSALEIGQESLSDKIDTGFEAVQSELSRSQKEPVSIPSVITLGFVILGGFAGVITYLNGLTVEAVQRENDLRFQAARGDRDHIIETISGMNARMLVDDKREQKDMQDKGKMEAQIKDIQTSLNHVINRLDLQQDRERETNALIKERLSALENNRL